MHINKSVSSLIKVLQEISYAYLLCESPYIIIILLFYQHFYSKKQIGQIQTSIMNNFFNKEFHFFHY